MIYLQTLGRLELRAPDGRRVRSLQARSKDLALLTYLAVAGRFEFQRRDTLLALFWPELDSAHGRNALNQALHRLRVSLPEGILISDGREEVAVSASRLSCDAVGFETHLHAGDVPAALGLYAGDFLAGFHAPAVASDFDDWIAGERERLQRRAFNAVLVLVETEEKAGRIETAVAWLRRALEMRPSDETICRRMVEALLAAGKRSEALTACERFIRRLREEYGLKPCPEIGALPDAIRSGRVAGARSQRRATCSAHPKTLEAFLKGRYFTSTIEHTRRGLECLQQAIDLDPAYAPAHAAVSMSVANLAVLGHVPPADARAQAMQSARRALELDSTLADAHTAIGTTAMIFDWDWSAAEREFRLAIQLNPNSSDAHAFYAQLLCAIGRPDEGVSEAEAAQVLDPLGLWTNFVLAWALFRARRHGQSIDRFHALLELYPHFAYAHLFLAENHVSRGTFAQAVEACRAAIAILPEDQLLLGLTACVAGLSSEPEFARALRDRLQALTCGRYVCPGHLAAAHFGAGDRERAFTCWAAMCKQRSALAWLVPADPLYDSARQDTRFGALFGSLRIPVAAVGRAIRTKQPRRTRMPPGKRSPRNASRGPTI